MTDDDIKKLTKVFSAYLPLSERGDDVRRFVLSVQKGPVCPGQLQLLLKMQDYRKVFFLRKRWNN